MSLLFIVGIGFILVLIKFYEHSKQLRELRKQVQDLRTQVLVKTEEPLKAQPIPPSLPPEEVPAAVPQILSEQPPTLGNMPVTLKKGKPFGVLDFIFQNVLGLMGALLALAGLVYLGYLSVFNLTALWRAGGMAVLGFGFSGVSLFMSKGNWLRRPGAWFQGIGGALLLLSAVGSAGIPGLQWIESGSPLGWILVTVAIGCNLVLAFLGGKEPLAILHGLFCFSALTTAPADTFTLIVAGVLTFALGVYSWVKRAPFHWMFTGVFSIFFLGFWHFRQEGVVLPLSLYGLFVLFHLFWMLLLSPRYWGLQRWKFIQSLGAIFGGLYLVGGLALAPQLEFLAPFYGISAMILGLQYGFFRSQLRSGFKTLQVLLMGSSGLSAILFMIAWEWDVLVVFSLGGLYGILWTIFCRRQWFPESLTFLGVSLQGLSWFMLILTLSIRLGEISPGVLTAEYLFYLLPFLSLGVPVYFFPTRKLEERESWILSQLAGIGWLISVILLSRGWGALPLLCMGFILGVLDHRGFMKGGRFLVTLGIMAVLISFIVQGRSWDPFSTGLWSLTILGWGIYLQISTKGSSRVWGFNGIIATVGGLLALPFFLFSRELPFLVGPLWLAVFLLILVFQSVKPVLNWGVAALIALGLFWGHHGLVVLQSSTFINLSPWGGWPVLFTHSALSALVGIGGMLWYQKINPWRLKLEILPWTALAMGLLLLVEFRFNTLVMAFSLTALVLWFLADKGGKEFQGFRLTSLIFHWISLVFLMTLSYPFKFSPVVGFTSALVQSLLAMGAQILYMVIFMRAGGIKSITSESPWISLLLKRWERGGVGLIVLPVALGIGSFLYWSSEGLVLNIGWLLEGFILFTLGLILKEKWLHYVSLGVVGATMGKLAFFDISQIEEVGKVLFIILTGAMLMLMSFLYGKFSGSKEEVRK